MTSEQVIIVDQQNRETGQVERPLMRSENMIHRASYVIVKGNKDKLFVQRRAEGKDLYPGMYEPGCAGVVMAGESYRQTAQRELAEELGIKGAPIRYEFDFFQETDINRVWGRVYSCNWQGETCLQHEEVAWGGFLDMAAIQALLKENKMTPDGKLILSRLGY